MLTLDQIRLLERKVNAAVTRIAALREENSVLEGKLEKALDKIDELEARIDRFKDDQAEIEQGILSALGQLDKLEDIAASDHDDDLDDDDAFEGVPSDATPGADAPAIVDDTADEIETRDEEDETDRAENGPEPGRIKTTERPAAAESTTAGQTDDSDEPDSGASDELDIF